MWHTPIPWAFLQKAFQHPPSGSWDSDNISLIPFNRVIPSLTRGVGCFSHDGSTQTSRCNCIKDNASHSLLPCCRYTYSSTIDKDAALYLSTGYLCLSASDNSSLRGAFVQFVKPETKKQNHNSKTRIESSSVRASSSAATCTSSFLQPIDIKCKVSTQYLGSLTFDLLGHRAVCNSMRVYPA